ncbi:MAG: winged helix-turn-helix domain-containing protein [Actinobacteria bacterium]|nr:winged helix-turn-helix domain-containing protein [Actinomycetota bacterium]
MGRGKLAKLLRVMACSRGEFVSRDVLTEALWGERQPKDPDAAVEVLVSRLRRALGDADIIVTGPGGYSVDTSKCAVDIDVFSASAAQGRDELAADRSDEALRAFEDALALWGDPLAEDAYEEWAQPVRRELTRAHLSVLESGAEAALDCGDWETATELAERAREVEPFSDAATALLMRALAAAGNRVSALETFNEHRERLLEEHRLEPGAVARDIQREVLLDDPGPRVGQSDGGRPRSRLLGGLRAAQTSVGKRTLRRRAAKREGGPQV